MVDKNGFLMIEPKKKCDRAIIDDVTRKVTIILRAAKEKGHYKGHHTCVCGAESGSARLIVRVCGNKLETNSLIVHYVACHRDEIPSSQMKLVEEASYLSRAWPTEKEVQLP